MPTNTTNYNLVKPDQDSTNWGTDLNNNFDTIDTEIKDKDNRISAIENDTTDTEQNSRLDGLESTTQNHETRISTIESGGTGTGTGTGTTSSAPSSFWLLDGLSLENPFTTNLNDNYTIGFRVRVNETITLNTMRVYGYEERLFTVHIWDVETQTLLRSGAELPTLFSEWSKWAYIEPVTLEAGKEYILSYNIPDDGRTHTVFRFVNTVIDHESYDQRISITGGAYADGADTFPASTTAYIYGPIDLGFIDDTYATHFHGIAIDQPDYTKDGKTLVYNSENNEIIWEDNHKNSIDPEYLLTGITTENTKVINNIGPITLAHEFTCLEDIDVNSVRIFADPVRVYTIKIWDAADQSLIKTISLNKTNTGAWSDPADIDLFHLQAGKNYVVGYTVEGSETTYERDIIGVEEFIDPRINIVQGRYDRNTTSFPLTTTTGSMHGIVSLGFDLEKAAMNDSTLQGLPVNAPTTADSGKVLAYDDASQSYVWVDAPSGTDSGTTSGGSTVTDSATNGNLVVDGAEVQVWDNTDNNTRLNTLESTTSDHETRISTIEGSGGTASTDAESIHGKAVTNPAAADSGRVLAYDDASQSYIWVDAPAGTSTTDPDLEEIKQDLAVSGSAINMINIAASEFWNSSISVTPPAFYGFEISVNSTFEVEEIEYGLYGGRYVLEIWKVDSQELVYSSSEFAASTQAIEKITLNNPITLTTGNYRIGARVVSSWDVLYYRYSGTPSLAAGITFVSGVNSTGSAGTYPSNATTSDLYGYINPITYEETYTKATNTETTLNNHTADTSNPHSVTAEQTGAIPTADKGVANGVASLDSAGQVPAAQLPEETENATSIHGNSITAPTATDSGKALVYDDASQSYIWSDTGSGGTASTDAESIHGKAVTNPAAADSGKVLAYDDASQSYIWVDAPTGTSTSDPAFEEMKGDLEVVGEESGLINSDVSSFDSRFYASTNDVYGYEVSISIPFEVLEIDYAFHSTLYRIEIWKVDTQELLYTSPNVSGGSDELYVKKIYLAEPLTLEPGNYRIVARSLYSSTAYFYARIGGEVAFTSGVSFVAGVNNKDLPQGAYPETATGSYAYNYINLISKQTRYIKATNNETAINEHKADTSNPHSVTAEQVGAVPSSIVGSANGVASLGADGKVPAAQLPDTLSDGGTTTTTSTSTSATAAGMEIVKVGTINPADGADILSHSTEALLPLETFEFTLDEETEILIETSLYARSASSTASVDLNIAISPDSGSNWWHYQEPTSVIFNAPEGHIGQRIRIGDTSWKTGRTGMAYGVFPAGTYRVGIYHSDADSVGIAASNNTLKVFGQPTASGTATAVSKQWFDYMSNSGLIDSSSAFNTKGVLFEPDKDIVVHGFSIYHQHSGDITGKIVEISDTNVQIGAPIYESEIRTGSGSRRNEVFELSSPITFRAGGRYIIALSGAASLYALTSSTTSGLEFFRDTRTGNAGNIAARTTTSNPIDGTTWDFVSAIPYYGGIKIEI